MRVYCFSRWKQPVKLFSLGTVLLAASANVVFYFAFNTQRTTAAAEALEKRKTVSVSPMQGLAGSRPGSDALAARRTPSLAADALYVRPRRLGLGKFASVAVASSACEHCKGGGGTGSTWHAPMALPACAGLLEGGHLSTTLLISEATFGMHTVLRLLSVPCSVRV